MHFSVPFSSPMRPRSLENLLRTDPAIARLSGHAAKLMKLQAALTTAIPAALARGARVANLKQGTLLIHAENGAVAAKLRQMAPRLVDRCRCESPEVTGIEIRVQAAQGNALRRNRNMPTRMGQRAKQGLTSLEESLPERSPLRLALARLIERG